MQQSSSTTCRFLCVALAVLVTLFCLCASPASANDAAKVNPLEHCHKDFRRLCVDKVGAGANIMSLWACMRESVAEIDDEVCRDWIRGMIACEDDAKKVPGCVSDAADPTTSLRRCLRTLEDDKLSETCRGSGFLARIRAARADASKKSE